MWWKPGNKIHRHYIVKGLSWWLSKKSACSAGDLGLIPGLGRSPGEGPATHSSILAWRIPVGWWAISPWGRRESDMTERLSTYS